MGFPIRKGDSGNGLQSSGLGQPAVEEGAPHGRVQLHIPTAALAPIRCAQVIDDLQRGLRTLFLSFIATVSLGFT